MSKRWKPEYGGYYYFMDSVGTVNSLTWRDDTADNLYYEMGNCFRTSDEAEAAAVKVRALLLGLHDVQPTKCTKLPKLTADVFDREDCPKWARWATVNADGTSQWYNKRPSFNSYNNSWYPDCTDCLNRAIEGEYDASGYENSLIERPAKLPAKDGSAHVATGEVGNLQMNYYEFIEQKGDSIIPVYSYSHHPYETVTVEYVRRYDNKRMKIVLPNKWTRHAIAAGNDSCPRCGNKLIILQRHKEFFKDGFRFVGCSNYPNCTYRKSDRPEYRRVHYNPLGGGSLDIDELYDMYGGEVF